MIKVNASGILTAIKVQVIADLRPNLLGAGAFGFLTSPAILLAIVYYFGRGKEGETLSMHFAAGIVAVISGLAVFQLMSEMYTERLGGTLLRVRTLPNGPMIWAIAKSISTLVIIFLSQIVFLIGLRLIYPETTLTSTRLSLLIGLLLLGIAAHAPLGFIVGVLARGTYSQLLAMVGVMLFLASSGGPAPLGIFPRWVQIIQLGFPSYWTSHLSRYIVFNGDLAQWELGGAYNSALALVILLAWTIGGYILATFVIKRNFRKETVGSLEGLQTKVRSQIGM
ncbi:MAG: ABC transporter permease [Actinomycetaceae bacterium]|nr:ABC transporter permease [Actinomycetaceae bacterium]